MGIQVWFDKEGDFLEITTEKKQGFFKDLGNGVFERVDEEGNTIGFALLNVSQRSKREIEVPFALQFKKPRDTEKR